MNVVARFLPRVGLIIWLAMALAQAKPEETAAPGHAATEGVRQNSSADWTQESDVNGVIIQSRIHEGSDIREFKGVGAIEATPSAVFAILDDSEAYPSFMPYTSECRILKREKNGVVAYQRLDVPLVSDRDYTLRSQNTKWLGPDGIIFRIRWSPANEEGPAVKPGVQRVHVCEGGWLLEPDGASGTRATYSVFTDSGGALPPFLANKGSRIAIRKVFDAIRKRVKNRNLAAGRNESADISAH